MRRSRRGLCVPHASVTLWDKCHPIHDTGRVISKINSEEGDVGSSGSQCGLSSLRSAHRQSGLCGRDYTFSGESRESVENRDFVQSIA